jgi:DNA polymerase III alpha subunit
MITAFDMYDLEEIGCLKLDILGLKTLDVIAAAHPEGAKCLYDPEEYFGEFDDKDVYELIQKGQTKGIFQLESKLGKQWCRKVLPENQLELSDLNAILRPAVLEVGLSKRYVDNKFNPANIQYLHPDLIPILQSTYGCQIYQEQMIKISEEFAGYDKSESDLLRKAVGKKIPEKLKKLKKSFVEGVKKKKGDAALAEELWRWVEQGATYGFNKSHSMCYGGFLGYITGYMKVHYPEEFFLALLNFSENEQDPLTEIKELFFDARLFDIAIEPPSIPRGNINFELDKSERKIYFGLNHIKDVGISAINILGKIKNYSWYDILFNKNSVKIKKDVLKALIVSGALDHVGIPRKSMIAQLEFIKKTPDGKGLTDKELPILTHILYGEPNFFEKKTQKLETSFGIIRGTNFKDSVKILMSFLRNENNHFKLVNAGRSERLAKQCEDFLSTYDEQEFSMAEKAFNEEYYLGIPVTCSRADAYYNSGQTHCMVEVERELDNIGCCTIGVINKVNKKLDKRGREMCFVGMEDRTFTLDVIFFSNQYEKFQNLLKVGNVLLIEGVKKNGSLIVNNARPCQ